MTPRLVEARHVRDFIIYVQFADGAAGEVDLAPELWGPVFEPLQDRQAFQHFTLDTELNTIRWPNGADFAPEFLHDAVEPKKVSGWNAMNLSRKSL